MTSAGALALGAVAALALGAADARARFVVVQGEHGPVYTYVPEPVPTGLPEPSSRRLAFAQVVEDASRRHHVDASLVEAVIACESAFDPTAVSGAGACGLMQLMPDTAKAYGLEDLFDVEGNVDAGTRHLGKLLRAFEGDWRLAAAAYNAGESAVRDAHGVPPFRETQRYVEKVAHYLGRLGDAEATTSGGAEAPAPTRAEAPAPRAPSGPPVRMVRDAQGHLVITNESGPGRARSSGGRR